MQQHLDRMQETAKVNYVKYGRGSKAKGKSKPKPSGGNGSSSGSQPKTGNTSKISKPAMKGGKPKLPNNICWRCGKPRHQKPKYCKALEAVCRGCNTKGHYEKVCMKKSAHQVGVHDNSDPEYYDELGDPVYAQTHMVSINQVVKKKHLIQFPISVDLQKVRKPAKTPCPTVLLKADTGADVNLLNSSTFDKAIGDRSILQPSSLRMEAYGSSTVLVLGKFHAFLRWKNQIYKQLFYVTSANASPNLLSRDSCYMLGVLKPCYSVETSKRSSIQTPKQAEMQQTSTKHSISKDQLKGAPLRKEDILETYTDVFTGIGKFPGPLYKFKLKPNAKPARHALRRVPIHLQEAFHQEIRNLEHLGILEPVKEVTEWVNSFVIVEKKADPQAEPEVVPKKKLRICLDPRDLNEALEHEPYYTRSIEEILGKFHGMKKFTIADFNKGYWMVELHPESRKLTTMALDIGRSQWTRLPMGCVVAQDVFQWKLDAIFLNIPGVTGIANDMIVYGQTDQEHDVNLLNFLEVCRRNNLTLNPDKMQFRLPRVSFFGHTWSDKGLAADLKKIEAVKKMKIPQDVETMRSFLGMINYLNRFSPRLAELSNPLRQICRQKEEFQLSEACEDAFHRCKEEISKKALLFPTSTQNHPRSYRPTLLRKD